MYGLLIAAIVGCSTNNLSNSLWYFQLLQCVASHPETRILFLNGNISCPLQNSLDAGACSLGASALAPSQKSYATDIDSTFIVFSPHSIVSVPILEYYQ